MTPCTCNACDECNLRRMLAGIETQWRDILARLRWPHEVALDEVAEHLGAAHTTLAMHIEARRMGGMK